MRRALLGILLASVNCGVLGAYVVTRRMAFVSTALTHTILPGVVFAWLRGFSPQWGALAAALLTALGVGGIAGGRELREDTAIGVVFSFMFALGVWLMTYGNSYRDFHGLLFGSALGVTGADLWMIAASTALILVLLALFHKELELSSYDEEYARFCGFHPKALRLLLLVLTALGTVSCVQIVGALLTTALLVTPAAAAVLVARTLPRVMALSACIGAAAGAGGLALSFYHPMPAGAAVALLCSAFFFVVFTGKWLATRLRRRSAGNR